MIHYYAGTWFAQALIYGGDSENFSNYIHSITATATITTAITTRRTVRLEISYLTRQRPWTERELAFLPPDLHVNGRQVMGTGTLTTVINYTLGLPASQQMLKLINFNANSFNISPKQILVYSKSSCSLIACISLAPSCRRIFHMRIIQKNMLF